MPICRAQFRLPEGGDKGAIEQSVRWIANRCGSRLPEEAFAGDPFDTGLDAAAPALALAGRIDASDYWAAKLRFPDRDWGGRTWLTEIVIERSIKPRISVRLAVKDRSSALEAHPPERTVPGIVRQIVEEVGAYDRSGKIDIKTPLIVSIDEFEESVLREGREIPLLLFGQDVFTNFPSAVEKSSNSLIGVCRTAVLDSEASWQVVNKFSKPFTVFGLCAKLYYPIENKIPIDPFDHPLIPLDGVTADELRSLVIQYTMELRYRDFDPLPRFAQVSTAVELERMTAASPTGMLSANEIAKLGERLNELEEERNSYEDLLGEAAETARSNGREISQLRNELQDSGRTHEAISAILSAMPLDRIPISPPPLLTLSVLDQWCAIVTGKTLVLTKQFHKSATELPDDPAYLRRIASALHGIARVTAGQITLNGRNIPVGQGVEICPVGDTEGRSDYDFNHENRQLRTDWHAKWGNGHDIRAAFRIYYYWDQPTNQAILQCVTPHLSNKSTN